MTRHGFVRIAAAGCALLTLGTAAYACCYYHLTWGENAPCDGEITEVCEWSSPGCASATDLSCMRTIGSRHGKCYKYILTTGDAWGRFACDAAGSGLETCWSESGRLVLLDQGVPDQVRDGTAVLPQHLRHAM